MAKINDYNGEGDPKDFAPNFQKQPEPYGEPIPELLAVFDQLPSGSTILDVAGGYGRYAIPLAQKGFEITIVDMHQASLDEANRRAQKLKAGAGTIKTVFGDVIRDDLVLDASFDAVTTVGFMHHLNDLGATALFDTMVEYTKPGGKIVVEYSTNKDRRMPSGVPILVDGVAEHNKTLVEGVHFLQSLFNGYGFSDVTIDNVPLKIRQPDFWYDADVLIASGKKPD